MSMPFLLRLTKGGLLGLILVAFISGGCEKENDVDAVYELNPIRVQPANTGKTKIKSTEQYISILHTNFFEKAISVSNLVDYTEALYSVGDQQLAREVLISNFMNDPSVVLPVHDAMHGNFQSFMIKTYQRFFVRNPTEAEKVWFYNYFREKPEVTAELVYFAFALSNEYQSY